MRSEGAHHKGRKVGRPPKLFLVDGSPTGAVAYGGNVSGPATWKREGDGLPYKAWRRHALAQARGGAE